ncbi:hypothetical protein PINS_up013093 [Pythium insidiosum]|nr:hypothetical protein PINS_up013093 [Pythium insidiosum]
MASAEDDDDTETCMTQFVDSNIIKWIRVVCAQFPSANFVFVGTKADLIAHDASVVQAIGDDLRRRLERNEQAIGDAIERERSTLLRERQQSDDGEDDINARLQTLESLRSQRPRYISTELLVVSSADLTGMQTLRTRLEAFIAQSDTGFLMPPIYSQLHEHLHRQATDAIDAYRSSRDVGTLVECTFVSVDALYAEVKQTPAFQTLELDEWTAILHVLHDLGDVLWYDVDRESALVNTVFLSPSVVIDFVRCVVNHTLGRPEHAKSKTEAELFALVASEGRVKHKLLERLEMWHSVSRETMIQLKELLWLFQLAYPHTSGGLKWDSDLVIPLYWKRHAEKAPVMDAPTLQWEYVFRVHLPETLFERFCVQNYAISASCDRQHARDWCRLSRDGVADTLVHRRIVSVEGETFPAVAITVSAQSTEIAWRELVPFCMSMERLLEKHPGLWVSRCVVSARGRRYDVDELVRERVEQERMKGGVSSASTSTLALLPPDMRWYMERWWRERAFARVVQTPDANRAPADPRGHAAHAACARATRIHRHVGLRGDHRRSSEDPRGAHEHVCGRDESTTVPCAVDARDDTARAHENCHTAAPYAKRSVRHLLPRAIEYHGRRRRCGQVRKLHQGESSACNGLGIQLTDTRLSVGGTVGVLGRGPELFRQRRRRRDRLRVRLGSSARRLTS